MPTQVEESTPQCVSVAEFARSIDARAWRRELVHGLILTESYPGPQLPASAAAIALPIFDYLAEYPIGRCLAPACAFALSFNPPTVRVPDVAFITHDRLERMRKLGCVQIGYPDLAALVVTSPAHHVVALERADDLLHAGTRIVWMLEPWAHAIAVLRPDGDRETLWRTDVLQGEAVLPGFECKVCDLLN